MDFSSKNNRNNKFCATLTSALGEQCNPQQNLCLPGFICTTKGAPNEATFEQQGFQQQGVFQQPGFQQQGFQQQGGFQNRKRFVR